VLLALSLSLGAQAQQSGAESSMTFFVTSVGRREPRRTGRRRSALPGVGRRRAPVATAWRAYLSTQTSDGQPAVAARDRIESGPWQNAEGTVIARDLEELHGANNLDKESALTERGDVVNGRGDDPNRHDILTGSQPTGRRSWDQRIEPAATGR
jgi:hypothetical protein